MTLLEHDGFVWPCLVGDVPGPRSRELLDRQARRESDARVGPRHLPIAVEEASGCFVRDVDGNVFIDFLAAAGVLSLGHNHPDLVRAVIDQLGRFVHGLDLLSPAKDAFTEAQLSMLPAGLRDRLKVHFCGPTGANAVDAAIRLCQIATGRGDVISLQSGFHGTTHQMGLTRDICSTNCIDFLERSLRDPNGGVAQPAAVVVGMVQGEDGVVPADDYLISRLRVLTRDLGVPLVVDEMQTGCGRTGTWFAFEQYGIEPDVIVASNALSGIGLPVAIILYDKRLDVWTPGAHTGTFRGDQLAFAAGAEAVRVVERDDVLGNVRRRGLQIDRWLGALAENRWVREVRGRGLMWGIELVDAPEAPAGTFAAQVQARALSEGLIVELGGRDDSVVRMLPPLNVTAEVVDMACMILIEAIEYCAPTTSRLLSLVPAPVRAPT